MFPDRVVPELFTGHDPTGGSGQDVFEISLVGSGRVGSGREVSKLSRVGSDRVTLSAPPHPRGSVKRPCKVQRLPSHLLALFLCVIIIVLFPL